MKPIKNVNKVSINKTKPNQWALIIIILLSFTLRVYRLNYHSLRGDEAASATYASLSITEIMAISREADPHPPLFYVALHGWEYLVGYSEFAVRFWVLIPAVLAIALLFKLTEQLLEYHTALLAAFLLAINSFHIWHSQDARSYTWLVLFGILTTWLLWKAITHTERSRNTQNKQTTNKNKNWIYYGLGMALLFYLHYYALFLVAFHGLYIIYKSSKHKWQAVDCLIKWGGAVLAAGLLILPWLSISWKFVTAFTGDFLAATPWLILWRGLQAFSGALVTQTPQFLEWVLPLILLSMWGFVLIWQLHKEVAIFLLLYLGLPFGGIMLLSLRGQAFTERYLIAALPPYLIFLAMSMGVMWQLGWKKNNINISHKLPARFIFLFSIGLIIIINFQAIFRYQRDLDIAKSPQWRQVFNHINQTHNPYTDSLIYNFPEASITYYLDTKQAKKLTTEASLPIFLLPSSPNPDFKKLSNNLQNLLTNYQRVWFVPVNSRGWDDNKSVETWLMRHADRIAHIDFHWARAELYLTPTAIKTQMIQQPTTFANGLILQGFQLFNNPITATKQVILNDEALDLSLYWKADNPTETPYTVFVQLIDSTGFLRGGQDNQPVADSYPTTQWVPQTQVVDKYQVFLQQNAPLGNYQIWVGLYNPTTGERVIVIDEKNNEIGDHVVLNVTVAVK